ncbi:MAG: D-glycerate dehydrogenase [Anaerolineae bacterium]|jgi:lactate dehydrogenase-like 2-hydroxyacid dehydrogenase|nr:D-glycerate dehydrogenase [Anaerolineae bacterium]
MSKPKVFVGRVLPEGGLEMIRGACDADVWPDELPPSREALLERVRGVDGLVSLLTDPVDAEVMDVAGPGLKVISNYAVGYDNVDVPAATARGIPVGNTPGVLTETTADLAFALLMAGARRIVEGADYVRAGKWRTWGPMLFLGHDVHGATLGIVGMGRIGQAMTRRAAGFGMRVVYYDPYCNPEKAPFLNITVRCDLDELLAESDFVSLHVPLTDQTHQLIDARALDKMKKTGVLINTSRGPVVHTDDLYEALAAGRIAYAALDVTDPEPLPPGHKLLSLPNCLVVPHIASASWATRTRMAVMAAENLLAGLRGERLPNCVNPEVYDARS